MRVNVEIMDHIDFYSHNDMDMMEIGNGNLTIPEQRTHFAVWAFMKSPILIGTDVRLELYFVCHSRCEGTDIHPVDEQALEGASKNHYQRATARL